MIPKIIHQTWKTNNIPDEWVYHVNSWKWNHPTWEYKLWTDKTALEFVAENYPQYLAKYCGFPYNIQRADFIRYLVVYHFGGIYADIDYECLRPFDDLVEKASFIIGYEPEGNKSFHSSWPFLCNALFISESKHPFLKDILESIVADTTTAITNPDVLTTTGPLKIQWVYDSNHYVDVLVLPADVLCPVPNFKDILISLSQMNEEGERFKLYLINHGAYAIHYWSNSWVGRGLMGGLINENPYDVEGFTFHQGVDSPFNDVMNGGRNIQQLAQQCLELEDVVAFNTDGYGKSIVRDLSQCVPMNNAAWNEGLYIKNKS